MKLDDGQGTTFDLDIMGYQFDNPTHGVNYPSFSYSDCNWLMVKGTICLPPPHKSWKFLRPCLNVHELKNLAEWFRLISTSPIPRTIEFVEPNLHLSFISLLPIPEIQLKLSYESSSPWKQRTFPGFDELTFPAPCNDLAQISRELYDLASKFPPRNQGGPACE